MPGPPQEISIFLASSAELKEERDAFMQYIAGLNNLYVRHSIFLRVIHWEKFLDNISNTRLQDEYNKELVKADMVVCLFFTKVGKYTAEEFDTAYDAFKATGKPKIWTYFKKAAIDIDIDEDEIKTLWAFKKKLSELGHFHSKFSNAAELQNDFRFQLDSLLPQLTVSIFPAIDNTNDNTASGKSEKELDEIYALIAEPKEINIKSALNRIAKIATDAASAFSLSILQDDFDSHKENKNDGMNARERLERIAERLSKVFERCKNIQTGGFSNDQDKNYALLCQLDFTHQTKYFKAMLNDDSRKFFSFVIRGPQARFGQRWLANKLIHLTGTQLDPFSIDFIELSLSLDTFIEHLGKALDIRFSSTDDLQDRITDIIERLIKRLQFSHQLILLMNTYSFIESTKYESFKNTFLFMKGAINKANKDNTNKCIFLLVEEQTNSPFPHAGDCIFSECTSLWDAKRETGFRFIDLGPTKPLNVEDFKNWLGECQPVQVGCFNALEFKDEKISSFLGEGNPEEVIPLICKKLDIDYASNEKLWLRY